MKKAPVNISLNGSNLSQVKSVKHLGVIVNETFSWSEHVDIICRKAAKRIGLLHRLRKRLPCTSLFAISTVLLSALYSRICKHCLE